MCHEGFLLRAAPPVLPSAASAHKGEEHRSTCSEQSCADLCHQTPHLTWLDRHVSATCTLEPCTRLQGSSTQTLKM